jgi:hypothetical protein
MQQQNYKNHASYYPLHHFVFYPLVLLLLVLAGRGIVKDEANACLWAAVGVLGLLLGWLSFMMRQHYSLTGQNRMVRMEMRFRYYVLTGQRFEPLEQQLSFRQVAALRFAPDEELPALVKRALAERLSPDDIKKSIKNWLVDDMRV